MPKDTISATVDPEVAEWLGQPGRNGSETVNQAVKAYMESGGSEKSILTLRLEQLKSERRSVSSQLDNIDDEIDMVESRLEDIEQENKQERKDDWDIVLSRLTFKKLQSADRAHISSDDDFVAECAEDVGMPVGKFREEAIQRWEDRDA